MLILRSTYAKNERIPAILAAIVLFSVVCLVGSVTAFKGRQESRTTGRGNVYNSESRTFREVMVDGYSPLPGDAVVTEIYRWETRRSYFVGVLLAVLGLFNLVVGMRVLRDRWQAI